MKEKPTWKQMQNILDYICINDFDGEDYLDEVSPEFVKSLIEEVFAWRRNSGPG